VKLLISFPSININQTSIRGSALHIAAKEGRVQIVSLLLENNANPLYFSEF